MQIILIVTHNKPWACSWAFDQQKYVLKLSKASSQDKQVEGKDLIESYLSVSELTEARKSKTEI